MTGYSTHGHILHTAKHIYLYFAVQAAYPSLVAFQSLCFALFINLDSFKTYVKKRIVIQHTYLYVALQDLMVHICQEAIKNSSRRNVGPEKELIL